MKQILLGFLLCCTTLSAQAKEGVILLHGIARSASNMEKIETSLKDKNYNVLNIDYPSTTQPLEEIRQTIHPSIQKFAKQNQKIHFITHSMGGLVTRAYLNKYKIKNLGRVVMLSPPNQGSEVADFLKNNFLYKKIYGPAGQQLITDQTPIDSILGEVYYELGIIAGTWSIDPLSSFIIPGNDDGKVSTERMKVKGMKAYIETPTTHTFMMKNEKVISLAIRFIETGQFKSTSSR